MESIENNWNGEIENEQSAVWQLDMIDTLLINANIDQEEKDKIHWQKNQYNYQEADETIYYLKNNQYEQRPEKQWINRVKRTN